MPSGAELQDWTHVERMRIRACSKALLLGEPALMPRLGRFALSRLIGRGAYGAVYEASDLETGERVALKTLRKAGAAQIFSFKQEFRALAGIAHENLVHLQELFADGDEWYFTMELVAGLDFAAYARADATQSDGDRFARLRAALAGLAAGVQAIHRAGKLHRDLKPSNVRVTEAGRVVVLDYGLVSAGVSTGASLEASGTGPFGTPEYMAPELIRHGAPSPASDVYAIGVMLFVALTGRLPFPARGNGAMTTTVGRDYEAPRARSSDAGVPEELDALCAALLAHDPGARPTIGELLSQLGAGSPAPQPVVASEDAAAVFVGRYEELATLRAALQAGSGDRAVALLVSGASGIGKSALVEQFADQVGEQAFILTGRCYEREALPFKAFDGIIDALARHLRRCSAAQLSALLPQHTRALVQVFPALKRVPGVDATGGTESTQLQELRSQAFHALKCLLVNLSKQKPIVLIVDDLQWGDLDSARLLLELLSAPDAPRLLYVGCYRSEDELDSEFLAVLRSSPLSVLGQWELRNLPLGALDDISCSQLASRLLGGRVARVEQIAARIAREAAGMPIFVRELAHHFATAPAASSVALSLRELLSARIGAMPEEARHALSLLALAARPVPRRVLAQAVPHHERWQHASRALQVAGLVRSDVRGALVIYHDRIRELSAGRLTDDERARLHTALARAYEVAHGAEPEWLIEHWRGAGDAARALEYAIVAANAAGKKLAFNRAAALYRIALELIEHDDARETELQERLGEVLGNDGRGHEAAAALLAASRGAGADRALSLRCRATQQEGRSMHLEACYALMRELLADVGIRFPTTAFEVIARVLWTRLVVAFRRSVLFRTRRRGDVAVRRRIAVLRAIFREYSAVDPGAGQLFQSLFHAHALLTGDRDAIFVGRAWDSYNRAFVAGVGGSRGNAHRIAALEREASELGTPYANATVALMRASTALFEGRYTVVAPHAADAQAIFGEQCVGALWEESLCASMRAIAIEIAGPLNKLVHDMPAMLRQADQRGDRFSQTSIRLAMTLGLLMNDEAASAREFLDIESAAIPELMILPRFLLKNRRMDCLRYCGESSRAWELWLQEWERDSGTWYRHLPLTKLMMHHQHARCALAAAAELGDDALLRIAERGGHIVRRIRRPEAPALGAAILAAVAWQGGEHEPARAALNDAVQGATQFGLLPYAACFRWQLARITPGDEGRRLMDDADRALRDEGVVNPAAWVEIYAPGFGRTRARAENE